MSASPRTTPDAGGARTDSGSDGRAAASAAVLGAAVLASPAVRAQEIKDITGAGASFPFPVYAKWAEA